MNTPADLIRRAYASFNSRDIDAALAILHPDVDWPNGMEGGRVRGHAAVREYWTRQWAVIDPQVVPLRIEDAAAGRTVVHVHQVVRDPEGNVLLDQTIRHVYTVEDGLVRSMEIEE